MKTFEEYEQGALSTAQGLATGLYGPIYCSLGLSGEAGELANFVKKQWRDHGDPTLQLLDGKRYNDIVLECGDVLWYLALLCRHLGLSLADVAQANYDKLTARYGE